ncbi:hypothetical protein RND81_11G161300 [Saponaria officinalis]|uniref:Polyadenylate-binding protein n=1 Tax=Saponaria officinalis TaxID=3572 RepID=A0AAW1HMR5_SAPOF
MSEMQQFPANGDRIQLVTTSLYVGDLEPNVTDTKMHELFSQIGEVISVRVCKDLTTHRSLGYGYVNFANPRDAEKAIKVMNFTPINNKPIRIMYSHRDPSIRKSGAGNIFIKNLDKVIDNKALHDTFSPFGSILSCKVASDHSGKSKGYGFVQFESEESAQKAIEKLNGILLNDKQVYIGPFLRKQERENTVAKTKFANVFVKNLAETLIDEDLAKTFGQFGKITSAAVMRDMDGKSKCFGFVNFENADDAARAIDALNGRKFDDKEWYVGKAQKKFEREAKLKQQFEQSMKESEDKNQGSNLYIKNLDDTIDEEKLRELFSHFGNINSCKIMRDLSGVSKGSGFVAFSTPEEASRAQMEMNGKILVSKPLYVALAQRKEDRKAKLQAQFSQMRPVVISPSIAPKMPMYLRGPPPIYPPVVIPSQPALGYQHPLMPGVRGGAHARGFYIPVGQQGHRPGGRRVSTGPGHQNHPPMPVMQQQMPPRGPYPYLPVRGPRDAPISGVTGGVLPGGAAINDASSSLTAPIGALATFLAHGTAEQQRLVEQLVPEMAAKVTGMLLEMDQTEVLHLLESPDALKAKVAEAMEVLRIVANNTAKQLAGLSLTDNLS